MRSQSRFGGESPASTQTRRTHRRPTRRRPHTPPCNYVVSVEIEGNLDQLTVALPDRETSGPQIWPRTLLLLKFFGVIAQQPSKKPNRLRVSHITTPRATESGTGRRLRSPQLLVRRNKLRTRIRRQLRPPLPLGLPGNAHPVRKLLLTPDPEPATLPRRPDRSTIHPLRELSPVLLPPPRPKNRTPVIHQCSPPSRARKTGLQSSTNVLPHLAPNLPNHTTESAKPSTPTSDAKSHRIASHPHSAAQHPPKTPTPLPIATHADATPVNGTDNRRVDER